MCWVHVVAGESNFCFRRGTPSPPTTELPRGRSLMLGDPLRVAVMFTMRLHACERAYANQPPFDREVSKSPILTEGVPFLKEK